MLNAVVACTGGAGQGGPPWVYIVFVFVFVFVFVYVSVFVFVFDEPPPHPILVPLFKDVI